MYTVRITAAVCAVASIAIAQGPTLRFSTESVVGVFAQDGAVLDLKQVAGGVPIAAPLVLKASVGRTDATTTASPLSISPSTLGVRIIETGTATRTGAQTVRAGTTTSTAPLQITAAPHSFRMGLAGAVQGHLLIVLSGDASASARAGVEVDVDGDGNPEYRAAVDGTTQRASIKVNGALGVAAVITTHGLADSSPFVLSSSYRLDLAVQYQPDSACVITPYGRGCGPVLTGADRIVNNQHVFTFKLTGGFPNAGVALVFGDRPINFPIPGTQCPLLANPLALVLVRSDANGEANLRVPTPGPLGGTGYMQALPFQAGTTAVRIRSSNGLRVDCDA